MEDTRNSRAGWVHVEGVYRFVPAPKTIFWAWTYKMCPSSLESGPLLRESDCSLAPSSSCEHVVSNGGHQLNLTVLEGATAERWLCKSLRSTSNKK